VSHYRVGCDAHRRYSQFAVLDRDGRLFDQARVHRQRGGIRSCLEDFPKGTPMALETVGNGPRTATYGLVLDRR
jgi:hypothetical protein